MTILDKLADHARERVAAKKARVSLTDLKRRALVLPKGNAPFEKALRKPGHKRNAVLLNAGAGLYLNGKAETMAGGIKLAAELIDSGKALAALEKIIAVSSRPEVEP